MKVSTGSLCTQQKNNKTMIQKKSGSTASHQWLLYIYLHLIVTFTSTYHILWNIFQSLLPSPHNTVAILNSTVLHYKLNLWKCLTQNHCHQQKTNDWEAIRLQESYCSMSLEESWTIPAMVTLSLNVIWTVYYSWNNLNWHPHFQIIPANTINRSVLFNHAINCKEHTELMAEEWNTNI